MRVLVTYCWVRSSYAALRNLVAHGVEVHVADSYQFGMSQASLKKNSFDQYPSHYEDEEAFIATIIKICNRRKIDFIMASHNETEILSKHRNRLNGDLSILLPDAATIKMFNNKSDAYDMAISVGVPTAKRFQYTNVGELKKKLHYVNIDKTVVKLLTGNSSKGVFHCESIDETATLVQRLIADFALSPDRFPQVEEYVSGEGWGTSVLYWNGEKIAGFTHRRLREKIATGGTSTLREAALHEELEFAAEKIFSQVGWHGFAMAEFKVCPQTGKFWFIEVNPRLWGSLPLAIAAGVEFPYLAYLCATDGPETAKRYFSAHPINYGWRNLWVLGNITVAASELFRFRPLPAIHTLFGNRTNAVDDFFLDDPFVFPGEIMHYVLSAISKRSLNSSESGMVG